MAERLRRLGWLAAAVLAGWLAFELSWTPGVPASPPLPTDVDRLSLPALDAASPDLAALHVTLERPLFSDDRRPDQTEPDAAAGAESPAAANLPPVRLSGVIVAADGRRTVLVEPAGPAQGQEEAKRVGVGDQIAGWRIEEIGEEAVVLSGGGQRSSIPLRVFETKAAGASARPVARRRPVDPARRPPARQAPAEAAAKGDADPRGQAASGAGTGTSETQPAGSAPAQPPPRRRIPASAPPQPRRN